MRIEIPAASVDLSGDEEQFALDAIRSGWISSSGEFVDRFEAEFAEICEVGHAISVCNGTMALHLALLAAEVGPGDEVLVPSLTYVAVANAVRYVGAEPVFVDVESATWCLDPGQLHSRVSPRCKAIIAVHSYGHPADMDAISGFASEHGLVVIEDAAEAHFARYKGQVTGGLGDIATFSFYGNKIVTCGEGGAVTTKNPEIANRVRLLRGQGMDPDRRFYFPIVGYNYRLTNVACALLVGQLQRREQIIARRLRAYARYDAALANVPGISLQPVADWAEPAPWLYSIIVDKTEFGCDRDELAATLRAHGIDTRPFFIPIHTLPPYQAGSAARGTSLPVTCELANRGLNLPTYNQISDAELDRVCSLIVDISSSAHGRWHG